MAELRKLSARDSLLAWYGALGAGLLWAVHLVVLYGWDEAACSTATAEDATEPVFLAVTGAVVLASIGAGLAAFVTWRHARSGAIADPRGRVAFLGFVGMLSAVIFTFATILEGIHVLVLPPCAPG